jgi:hypothetical protein
MESFGEKVPAGNNEQEHLHSMSHDDMLEDSVLEGINIEMSSSEAMEVYAVKRELKIDAERHIDEIASEEFTCDEKCSKNDLANREEVKYLKAIMPGLIYTAVFDGMDNESIGTHVMSSVLAESPIEDGDKRYVYDDFDKKAVDLLTEFINIQNLQELVDLKNGLDSEHSYAVGDNGRYKDNIDMKAAEINKMKADIAYLQSKIEEMNKKYPGGQYN